MTQAGRRATTGDFALGRRQRRPRRRARRGARARRAARRAGSRARGHVPLGYFGDAEKTARTFPVIDGVRYSVPGDRAVARGRRAARACSAATRSRSTRAARRSSPRRSSTRSSTTPPCYDAVVVGTPHERWGQQVTAVVAAPRGRSARRGRRCARPRARTSPPTSCRKPSCSSTRSLRAPSGKADYRWASGGARRLERVASARRVSA